MKTIAYLRVSSDKQANEGYSLENQKARIESYCNIYNLEIIKTISDEVSGKNQNREGFKELMNMVSNKECEAIVVYSISRFARNSRDTLNCLHAMKENNVFFHSYTEKIDTNSANGKFFFTIMAAYAEMETSQISERVKSVKENNKLNLKTYSSPVYGFDNIPGGKMIINQGEMKIVDFIRERIKEISYSKLAKELNDRSERTKKGKKWHTSTLHGIVNNTIYDNITLSAIS